ncbi:3-hydroxyacyl-CoA dehydrogenase NAD-binding domain-containing protein, partial [Streptomyces sp. NPDC007044]|uniref:3-hydroxyacyl-CoA dehydrogenase NAD-binding domain-containing protein n=1 Tax=Streptomyces sp. NPDC007044 TaxID=3156911 RepID=UPI003455C634
AILATNTSSLSVSEMASKLEHPERVVGFHFFPRPWGRGPRVLRVGAARRCYAFAAVRLIRTRWAIRARAPKTMTAAL